MLIDFNKIQEHTISEMNGGTGEVTAKMYMGQNGKIIPSKIRINGSIGMHPHETSEDINYIISGIGKTICDGKEEALTAGTCHICKKGSSHSIINTGNEDLIMITFVVEK